MNKKNIAQSVKHTPGPWRMVDSPRETCQIQANEGAICRVADVWMTDFPDGAANARLIAAAPELLEALETVLCYVNYVADSGNEAAHKDCIKAETAIRKAKGEL